MMSLLTDLVWYWDLSSADASITDQHSGLTLTRIGTTTTDSTGGPDGGPCINFGNAAGKYRNASVAKTVSYDDGYTVNLWARSTAVTLANGANFVFSHRNALPPLYSQIVVRSALSGIYGDFGSSVDNANTFRIAITTQEALNVWQMLTLRDTGTATELYRNGSLVGSSSAALGARSTGAALFSIGGNSWEADNVNPALNHRGQLAKAGVWNVPLTELQIATLYNAGNGLDYAYLSSSTIQTRRRRDLGGYGL